MIATEFAAKATQDASAKAAAASWAQIFGRF
jgi:hypothetical protein